MLSVPELESVLLQAYEAFAAMLEMESGQLWGAPETALGASLADNKRYIDLDPLALSTVAPAIMTLHAMLLRALVEHEPMLATILGFSAAALADLADGPILRLSCYPGDSSDETVNQAHSDIDLVTLLPRATAPGLQIFKENVWQSCETGQNGVTLLIGDLAQEFGGPPPTLHRVVSDGNWRMSVSFFVNARPELILRDGSTVANAMDARIRALREIRS